MLRGNTTLRRSRRRSCGRGRIDEGDIAGMLCRECPTCNGRVHCPSASRRGRLLAGRGGNLRSSSHRQDGIWDALRIAAEALPSRARHTADLPWMTLHERQQDAVGLVNRQHGVDPLYESLHGPTGRRGPHAVEFAPVAPDALEFLLELASDGVAAARDERLAEGC